MTIRPPDTDFVPSDKDSSVLTKEARKILRQWARQGYYVYLRPVMSSYAGDSNNRVYWMLSVEYRAIDFQQIRGESYNLSKMIVAVSGRVIDRPKPYPEFKLGERSGWLAPKVAFEAEKAAIHDAREKAERKARKKHGPPGKPCVLCENPTYPESPDRGEQPFRKGGKVHHRRCWKEAKQKAESTSNVIPFERPRTRKQKKRA